MNTVCRSRRRRGGKGAHEDEVRAKRRANYRERVNSSLKDSYGGRSVRVRGQDKVFCHLMFGILALTVEQLMRLVT